MITNNPDAPLLPHLTACVTFHFVPERLAHLATVLSNYIDLARRIDVHIVTNIDDTDRIAKSLPRFPDQMSIHFLTPSNLAHPHLLTWGHREIFRDALADDNVTHFLYSEDDLLLSRPNVEYWLRYREPLRRCGFIPSFCRVERHRDRGWVSTDCKRPVRLHRQPKLILEDGTQFICMPNPYQGLYFLDRPLMEEFAASEAMSPDFGTWAIRERAAQGVTFVNVPKGYTSRNLVLVDPGKRMIPREAWIHHLSNNYAQAPDTRFGKLTMRPPGVFTARFDDHLMQGLSRFTRLLKSVR